MKLYFVPGACSRVPHIILTEMGIKFESERVDPKSKQVSEGDYFTINPKGQVPALKLDNGEVLTETAVISQYLADLKPELKLAPAFGTFERYRLMEWMNFIATELHKGLGPLWNPKTPDEIKEQVKTTLNKRFEFVAQHLQKNQYFMGNQFTIADAYFYVVMGWVKKMGLDLSKWPQILSLCEKVEMRPSVQTVIKIEA